VAIGDTESFSFSHTKHKTNQQPPKYRTTMSQAFRRMLQSALMPNLERDLSRAVATEMESAYMLLDNMCTPQAYAYTTIGSRAASSSASKTAIGKVVPLRAKPVALPPKKVYFSVENEGLFQVGRVMRA
jgi:hypothetical protein